MHWPYTYIGQPLNIHTSWQEQLKWLKFSPWTILNKIFYFYKASSWDSKIQFLVTCEHCRVSMKIQYLFIVKLELGRFPAYTLLIRSDVMHIVLTQKQSDKMRSFLLVSLKFVHTKKLTSRIICLLLIMFTV